MYYIPIPADAYFLNGYVFNGYVLKGYVLNGYIWKGYVLKAYILVGYVLKRKVLTGYVLNGYVWDDAYTPTIFRRTLRRNVFRDKQHNNCILDMLWLQILINMDLVSPFPNQVEKMPLGLLWLAFGFERSSSGPVACEEMPFIGCFNWMMNRILVRNAWKSPSYHPFFKWRSR